MSLSQRKRTRRIKKAWGNQYGPRYELTEGPRHVIMVRSNMTSEAFNDWRESMLRTLAESQTRRGPTKFIVTGIDDTEVARVNAKAEKARMHGREPVIPRFKAFLADVDAANEALRRAEFSL